MSDTSFALLIATLSAILIPILTMVVKGMVEREAKQQEYEQRVVIEKKLDVIKRDVNSNMTLAMENEYDSLVREVALLNEVSVLRGNVSDEVKIATDSARAKIKELVIMIEKRKAVDRVNV